MRRRAVCWLLCLAIALGCSTVTVRPSGDERDSSDPTWQERQKFYWLGLSGESHIDVTRVCAGRDVTQMQTQQTVGDWFLGLVTLGIYAPRTAKVWCGVE